MPKKNSHAYVLITPVKDEEALISETIASVVGQSFLPLQWVIVSDGSMDRTEEIVKEASSRHPWIQLICLPPRVERSFAAVVHATETGVRSLTVSDYQYIGLLDSDVRFEPNYFETIIQRFEENQRLGLGGGMVIDIGLSKSHPPLNLLDVPGATQFYRRQCYEDIGGLIAVPEGGWDFLTCARARMLGYETCLFSDLVMDHLKPRNICNGSILQRAYQMGMRDFALFYDPVFEFFKCMSMVFEYPPVLGSAAWLAGYCAAGLMLHKRFIPHDLVRFCRAEQRKRLKQLFSISKHFVI
jgi:glycosyltransferase involved in cell wall biosynthesis